MTVGWGPSVIAAISVRKQALTGLHHRCWEMWHQNGNCASVNLQSHVYPFISHVSISKLSLFFLWEKYFSVVECIAEAQVLLYQSLFELIHITRAMWCEGNFYHKNGLFGQMTSCWNKQLFKPYQRQMIKRLIFSTWHVYCPVMRVGIINNYLQSRIVVSCQAQGWHFCQGSLTRCFCKYSN